MVGFSLTSRVFVYTCDWWWLLIDCWKESFGSIPSDLLYPLMKWREALVVRKRIIKINCTSFISRGFKHRKERHVHCEQFQGPLGLKQIWLAVSTPLKNMSQNGNLPQVWMKIKNIWNHQPEIMIEPLLVFFKTARIWCLNLLHQILMLSPKGRQTLFECTWKNVTTAPKPLKLPSGCLNRHEHVQ